MTSSKVEQEVKFFFEQEKMASICGKYYDELLDTAKRMTAPGKGLLAADESTGTIGNRFAGINVENVEANRREYRQLLFKTKDFEKYVSGVIMYEETLFQKTDEGVDFTEFISKKGVLPGIKVDLGKKILPPSKVETTTQGLDNLEVRVQKHYQQGARFAKWRSELWIGPGLPSHLAVVQAAEGLARYACICQTNGLVPIVEPEIMVLKGNHSLEEAFFVTKYVLGEVYGALNRHHVDLARTILKPNMVLAGRDCPNQPKLEEMAEYTVKCLRETVPPAVEGIMFLSGGQSEEESVVNLNAINKAGKKANVPWKLTFSYGRGLQGSCLKAWQGKKENLEAAQKAFLDQCIKCYKAALGEY